MWILVASSLAAAFFVLLHLIDDLSQEGTGSFNQIVIAVTSGLLAIVWLFAITLSLRQERAGYAVVLVLGILGAYLALDHTAGLSPSLAVIAETSGPFFAWVLVGVGAASILATLLAGYGLAYGAKLEVRKLK
ncbi:MAG: hypothetical protein R3291_00155 [Thermoplasmata archaeon]|nr:hypothetical protein [Thermoplasmata archaeon]